MVEQILPQENSASNKLPFADAHCDFLYGMTYYDYDIQTVSGHQSMSLRNMAAGGVKLQFFAAWIDMLLKHACAFLSGEAEPAESMPEHDRFLLSNA